MLPRQHEISAATAAKTRLKGSRWFRANKRTMSRCPAKARKCVFALDVAAIHGLLASRKPRRGCPAQWHVLGPAKPDPSAGMTRFAVVIACYRGLVDPALPWKQCGREIRRGAPLARRTGRDRPRIGIRCDDLAIEMPGGMAEQRNNDGEA